MRNWRKFVVSPSPVFSITTFPSIRGISLVLMFCNSQASYAQTTSIQPYTMCITQYTGLFYSAQLCVCLWYLSWDFCCRNQSIAKLNRLGQSSSLHSAQCYAEFEICQAMKSIVYSTLYSAVYSALYREFDMCQPYSTIYTLHCKVPYAVLCTVPCRLLCKVPCTESLTCVRHTEAHLQPFKAPTPDYTDYICKPLYPSLRALNQWGTFRKSVK